MKYIAYAFALLAIALVVVGLVTAVGSSGAAAAGATVARHGMAMGPSLSSIGNVFVNFAIVAVITAIVSPLKRRLERKRQASAPARRNPAKPATADSA